jgi:hypothetical protein
MIFQHQDSNYPPEIRESDLYPELRAKRLKPNQPAPEPLTDAEREDMAVNFARVDEWDRRNRGQQFQ